MATIIGFSFTKLHAQQKTLAKGSLKIKNNIKLTGLEKTSLSFDENKQALKTLFTYGVTYEPQIGELEFAGDILFLASKDEATALIETWNKKKELPQKLATSLIQNIMQKCTIQAMIMARDIGLPSPVPLPKFKTPGTAAKK